MKKNKLFRSAFVFIVLVLIVVAGSVVSCNKTPQQTVESEGVYAGSESCKMCHERFYELWEPSHHGKAMQPITAAFLKDEIVPHDKWEYVGGMYYKVVFEGDSIFYLESSEPDGDVARKLPVVWALGGKNVYYFQTPWEGGRLQTLPLAYDLNRNEWYNNPSSGVRHFDDPMVQDSAVEWTHSLFTFNTTCHSCHVSQLEKNYNEETNEYHTIWKEPGINCETCHGPSQKHVEVCMEAAKKGVEPENLEIIMTSKFTKEEHNSSCAPCHAKMSPVTGSYPPAEDFYDHFDLIGMENPDFYPDGRDLGENYTMGTWEQSKCLESDNMHCVVCHTSSGRYRFKNVENPNMACASCHADNVTNFEAHTHHKDNGEVLCVSCHMPKTEFARMIRSDHSMRPPMPAASIKFGSPNACNICHDDKSNEWANKHVTEWKGKDYQEETLYYGQLVKEGRANNYARLDEMLKMIEEERPNAFFAASMIRILQGNDSEKKWPVLRKLAIDSEHPMVRSAAVNSLDINVTPETKEILIQAAQDKIRSVRVGVGAALAAFPEDMFTADEMPFRKKAFEEYKASITARPDSWSSHYNRGNFEYRLGEMQEALKSFEKASMLEPEVIGPYVNASLIHSVQGNHMKADASLRTALELDPDNAAVNVNYGLLMGEMNRFDEAKKAYLKALESDPLVVTAAYNLSVIYSQQQDLDNAILYARKAAEIRPQDSRYPYTYAFFLNQKGDKQKAVTILKETIDQSPEYGDAYMLLERIYMDLGNMNAIKKMYEDAAKKEGISPEARQWFSGKSAQLN